MTPFFKRHFTTLLLAIVFTSGLGCKDYYNDTIDWADSIPIGTEISAVKASQPDFVTINWNHPSTPDSTIQYQILKIKGNRDILKMTHYLLFVNNIYQGRVSKK